MSEFTSALANKTLKILEEQKNSLLTNEQQSSTYTYRLNETPEKPSYNFKDVRKEIAEIDTKMLAISHARNVFNSKTEVKDGLTLDMVLVKMAQLNNEKKILERMKNKLPKPEVPVATVVMSQKLQS
jgi:hypothetical protein